MQWNQRKAEKNFASGCVLRSRQRKKERERVILNSQDISLTTSIIWLDTDGDEDGGMGMFINRSFGKHIESKSYLFTINKWD